MSNLFKVEHNYTNDDTRDIAIRILDTLIQKGFVKDCTDTDDETEFEVQDIIQEELNRVFNIKED